ncbi:MAG: hypothetical protein ABI346_06785 [Candidatus Baltobacteraceae bacterium]
MQRFLTSLAAIAFAASLGAAPALASSKTASHMSSMSSMSTKCAKGESYTKGYKKKDGTKVKGYCHASKAAKSSSMSTMKKGK